MEKECEELKSEMRRIQKRMLILTATVFFEVLGLLLHVLLSRC